MERVSFFRFRFFKYLKVFRKWHKVSKMCLRENIEIVFGVIGKVLTVVGLGLVSNALPPTGRCKRKAETIYFKAQIFTVAFPFDIFPSFPLSTGAGPGNATQQNGEDTTCTCLQ